jgi:heterodisulfide reductase subunit A-like polyferredoxin
MRTGIFICKVETGKSLNIDALAKYAANLPGVELVQTIGINAGLDAESISKIIKHNNLE